MSVVGARPQFVKLGAMVRGFAALPGVRHTIVHTGQHYDRALSDAFFESLQIPAPDFQLNVGSGSHAWQTGQIMRAIEPILERERPDWLLVYGDTNSTLAAALAAVKLGVKIAHLEAGLRSFNRAMPEEHNRVLTDHAADLCLAPTELAMTHLAREGLADRSLLVGDVMTDICYLTHTGLATAELGTDLPAEFVFATIHRPANTDDPAQLARIVRALQALAVPVILAAHPRLVQAAAAAGLELNAGAVSTRAPLAYPALVDAVARARGVVTDSGGLQKEAYLLGTVCTTIRTETEWPETLGDGWNVLDPRAARVATLATRAKPTAPRLDHYGRGDSALRAARALAAHLPG